MGLEKVHFISGLPRSGSTLLSALLRQNPKFRAGITSPLAMLCGSMLQNMSEGTEFAPQFSDETRLRILRATFDAFYADAPSDAVVFDTNRTWTGKAALTAELYPRSRIICCVRSVAWIIDSIERLLAKNPVQLSRIFNFQMKGSVYARAEPLMNSERGLIGQPWASFREAWFGNYAHRLIVIPYEQLVTRPKLVLQQLYAELGEPEFEHDLDHVEFDAPDYDARLGMPGLHKVRSKVSAEQLQPSIPPDLFAKYSSPNFWTRPHENRRGVCILGEAYEPRKTTAGR